MSQPPSVLPYAPPPGDRRPLLGLCIGLLAGAAVSAILWGAAWHPIMDNRYAVTWLIAIPLAKVVIAGILLAFARTRTAGAGVLISVALGFLIFFGSCFAHL